LQVINHLQDCGEDARLLGRIYIPGASLEDLRAKVSSSALRSALTATVASTRLLLQQAQGLRAIKSCRLRAEVVVILALAEALLQRLSRQDPLAERVQLSAFAKLRAVMRGLLA
jgi:phytoene/squalene synthetase